MIRYEVEPSAKGIQRRLDAQGVDAMSPLRGAIQNGRGTQRALAYDGDRIVGGISFTPDRTMRAAYIDQMRVIEQRQGIGHGLLATVARSLPSGWTMIVTSAVSSAIPFYVKTGGEHSNPNSHVVQWSAEAVDRLRGLHTAGAPATGLTFRYDDTGDGYGRVVAWWDHIEPKTNLNSTGFITWNPQGKVSWVGTNNDEDQRRGVATALWYEAKKHCPNLHHSEEQSESGRAWARTTASAKTKVYRGVRVWVAAEDSLDFFKRTATSGEWLLQSLLDRAFSADFTGRKPLVEGDGVGVWWTTDRRIAEQYGGTTLVDDDYTFGMVLEAEVEVSDQSSRGLGSGYSEQSPVQFRPGDTVQITGITASWPATKTRQRGELHERRPLSVSRQAIAKTAMPSWRDRGVLPPAECVIAPDLGRNRRDSYMVYLYDQPHARRSTLAEAKQTVEEIYGPLTWERMEGDADEHPDHVWGWTTMFNDAPYYLIVERLPRLGVTADVVDYKADRPLTGPDARPITSLMPGTSMVDFDRAPFADALDAAMGTDRHGDVPTYLAARKAWWKAQPVTQMSLSTPFVVTQANVNLPRVQQMIDHPETAGSEPIWMVRHGGKVYTLNGHHRLVAEHMKGSRTIAAKVIDADRLPRLATAYAPPSRRSQVDWEHGPEGSSRTGGRGDVDRGHPRGPHVGPDHLGRHHHDRRDRVGAASQGARPGGVRPPLRVEAATKVAMGGPLALAFKGYSDERQHKIYAALKAFREGRVRPDRKERPPLLGCYTIPVGGLTTAEPDRLVLVKTVDGGWLAVYAVVNHNYGPAEQHVPAWLRSKHAQHVRLAFATGMPDNGLVTDSAKAIPMNPDGIQNPLWVGPGIYEMDISRWSSTRCVALLTEFPGLGVFPIGWLTWDTERHTIEGIFVNEDYRGKGIGVEMKAAAEKAAGQSLDNDSGEYTPEGLAWAKKHGIPKAKNTHPVSVSDMARMRGRMNNLLMGSDDLIKSLLLKVG